MTVLRRSARRVPAALISLLALIALLAAGPADGVLAASAPIFPDRPARQASTAIARPATVAPGSPRLDARAPGVVVPPLLRPTDPPVSGILIAWRSSEGRLLRPARARTAVPGIRFGASASSRLDSWTLARPLRGPALRRVMQQLAAMPGVERVSVDQVLQWHLTPNDPYYSQSWHLKGAWGIGAPSAWDVSTGRTSQFVAVLDTGYTDHPDITARILDEYDMVANTTRANDGGGRDADAHDPGDWVTQNESNNNATLFGCPVADSSWHGTTTISTVAASTNNAIGVAGVTWKPNVIAVRIGGKCGPVLSDLIAGIRWASGGSVPGVPTIANRARVISLSLGLAAACPADLQAAINEARAAGAVVVASAGNTGASASLYPANCAGVIGVAATDSAGKRSTFSSWGAAADVAAPGTGILVADNAGTTVPGSSSVNAHNGTSYSAPIVAGVALLIDDVEPGLTPAEIDGIITSSVNAFPADASSTGCTTVNCGSGIINADLALKNANKVGPKVRSFLLATAADTGSSSSDNITRSSLVDFVLTLHEPTTGLTTGDLTLLGTSTGCVMSVSGAARTDPTIRLDGCSEGTVSLRLAAASVTDPDGNTGPAANVTSSVVTIDRTAPVPLIKLAAADDIGASSTDGITNKQSLTFETTFPEAVSGVTVDDFSVTGCTKGALTTVGAVYSLAVTNCAQGTVTVSFAANGASDVAGNTGPALLTSGTATVDLTNPSVVSITGGGTSTNLASPATFTVTASEPISWLASGYLENIGTAPNCVITTTPPFGTTTVVASVTGCGEGTLRLRVKPGALADYAAHVGPAADVDAPVNVSFTIDKTAPNTTVLQLRFQTDSGASSSDLLTNVATLGYELNFSEPISGLAAADFTVTSGCTVTPSATSGVSLGVAVTCPEGPVVLTLKAGSIVDAAGNTGPASARTASTVTIDRTAPTLSMAAVTASPTTSTSLAFRLSGNEAIDCATFTAADLDVTSGVIGAITTNGASCDIAVTSSVPSGTQAATTLALKASYSIADKAGNAKTSGAASASITVNLVAPDSTPPSVVLFALDPTDDTGIGNDSLTKAEPLHVRLQFSESVQNLAAGDITAAGCTVGTPTGGPVSWTIGLSNCPAGTLSVSLAANSVNDTSANANAGPTSQATAPTITIDRTAPTLTLSAVTASPTSSNDLTFRLAAGEPLDCGTITAQDFTLVNGGFDGAVASGNGCDFTISGTIPADQSGTVSVDPSGTFAVADRAGNARTTATGSPDVVVDRTTVDVVAPVVTNLLVSPASATPGAVVDVSADISDNVSVASAEVQLGSTGWVSANAADGAFDETAESLARSFTVPSGSTFQVCARATDPTGNASDPVCATLTVTGATSVAAGASFTCAVITGGGVRCFGAGDQGQLGTGTTGDSLLPVAVRTGPSTELTGAVAVVAGRAHACALLSNGTVACWGDSAAGKQGDGQTATDALYAKVVSGLTGVAAIAAGSDHTCVRLTAKTVKCWGKNNTGQLGDGTTSTRKRPVAVLNVTGANAIAAGGGHTCVTVGTAKTVKCWGKNADGQLGDGTKTQRRTAVTATGLKGVTALAAGTSHTCARLSTGVVRCFGDNAFGSLGDGTTTDRTTSVAVSSLTGATGIAAGGGSSCAVLGDGSLRCWGDDTSSKLGDGGTAPQLTPVTVGGLLTGRTVAVAALGIDHACARLGSGGLVCWGNDARGQLGNGSGGSTTTPANRVRRLTGDARGSIQAPEPTPAPTAEPGSGDGGQATPAPTDDPGAGSTPAPEPTPEPTPDPTPEPPADPAPDASPEPPPA